jgi:CRP-like cAMP-binding protein
MRPAVEKFLAFLHERPLQVAPADIDLAALSTVNIVDRFCPAGTLIIDEGGVRRSVQLIASGWALSFKSMADGRRLVADFPVRGDLLSNGSAVGVAYRAALAVSDVTLFEVRLDRNLMLAQQAPFLATVFMHLMAKNFGIATEHLANIARRPPIERTIHLFLEMHHRLHVAGLAAGNAFSFPFTQSDLADALGLTAIHTNRVLRDLRENGLVLFRGAAVHLLDPQSLQAISNFDPTYLTISPPLTQARSYNL